MADMSEGTLARRDNPLVTAVIIVLIIAALYFGAGIFVPLVLAVLLAFALAPLVNQLRRIHIPNIAAVILAVALAAIVLATIGYVVATQLVKLAADLPSYQETVATKLKGLQSSTAGSNFIERLGSAIDQLKAQVIPAAPTLAAPGTSPVPVTIANTPDNPLGMVQSILGSVLGPLATAAIVVVFLVFLLLERADLRDRFLKLVSRGDLRTSTKVMDDAAARVGRYLLVQFSVNLSYGIILGAGLSLIGVPSGILWGLLATLFRYIPFVGTLILATIPFTLAFAIDPGWSMLLKSVALFVVLETTATNVVEPRLYGSSTGLSALAVLVAAMFWATLWGPIGLILATPLTVCLVVLGRHVPQLQFLETLLGSEPVLSPEERLYQRLVAGNTGEAIDIAEQYDAHDSGRFYEEVAIPALHFAEADLSVNPADLVQRRRVVDSLDEVIDELEVDAEVGEDNARIVVIGGRTELDGAAARIVASLMHRAGVPARVLPPVAVRREALRQLDTAGIDTVYLVYLGEHARSYVRFVGRQLKRQHPGLRLVAVMLGAAADSLGETASSPSADATVTTIADAVLLLGEPAESSGAQEAMPPVTAPPDATHLQRMERAIGDDPAVAAFLKNVAEEFGVAVAIATIADAVDDSPTPRESSGSGNRLHGSSGLTNRVVQTAEILVVADASKDKEFAEDAFLLESGVRFYAGAPLLDPTGGVLGVLSIMDETARTIEQPDADRLVAAASELVVILQSRTGLATVPAVREPA